MRDPALYLKEILDAMDAIEKFVEGMGFDEFKNNDLKSSAVNAVYKNEVINMCP